MTEYDKRSRRVCFTGHRPEKLNISKDIVCTALKNEIRQAVLDGFCVFISGMSRGVDLWAASIVLDLRNENRDVRLICAVPYDGFEKRWPKEQQTEYAGILNQADLVKYILPRYSSQCFQVRNEWMVNHSARVIAVWNGQPSGTGITVAYAQKRGVEVVNVLMRCNDNIQEIYP